MAKAKKQHPVKWLRWCLIPFWVFQIFFMCVLIAASGWLAHYSVIATEIIYIIVCCFCIFLTTAEIIMYIRRNLRPKLYLIFQVIKTSIWLIIFIITIVDGTTLSYSSGSSVVISTIGTDGQVVGSEDPAPPSPINVVLNGIVECSVILVTFLASLIYGAVIYHRDRKRRRKIEASKRYLFDFPMTGANPQEPQRSRGSFLRRLSSPYRRANTDGSLETGASATSPLSVFQNSPFSERGILSPHHPRNAWQQEGSCQRPCGDSDDTATLPQELGNSGNADIYSPAAEASSSPPNSPPVPTSPHFTIARTHLSRSSNTTSSANSTRTRRGPPPSYRSVDANRRSTAPSSPTDAPPYMLRPDRYQRGSTIAGVMEKAWASMGKNGSAAPQGHPALASPAAAMPRNDSKHGGSMFAVGRMDEIQELADPTSSSRQPSQLRRQQSQIYELRADRSIRSAHSSSSRGTRAPLDRRSSLYSRATNGWDERMGSPSSSHPLPAFPGKQTRSQSESASASSSSGLFHTSDTDDEDATSEAWQARTRDLEDNRNGNGNDREHTDAGRGTVGKGKGFGIANAIAAAGGKRSLRR